MVENSWLLESSGWTVRQVTGNSSANFGPGVQCGMRTLGLVEDTMMKMRESWGDRIPVPHLDVTPRDYLMFL